MNESEQKELVKERFGKYSLGYVTSKNHAGTPDLDRLVELAQPQKSWICLDIATGGGHTALKFAPYVEKMIASDITPDMLSNAEKFISSKGIKNVEYQIADAEQLPFENNQFELVSCRIAPHHFLHIDLFVAEVFRVLKWDGIFILEDQFASENVSVVDYINKFEKIRDPSHNLTLSKSQWEHYLLSVGFTLNHHETFAKRVNYKWWKDVQDVSAEIGNKLDKLVMDAPDAVKIVWDFEDWGTPECSYNIWQQIFKTTKISK
jgi:ubiquinone/menaquinone biosynthesis C-methylase UbiE